MSNIDAHSAIPRPSAKDEPCADCKGSADDFSKQDEAFLCALCFERRRTTEETRQRNESRFWTAVRRGDLPMAFRGTGFGMSDQKIEAMNPEAWAAARNWNANENLYLEGTPGTGKTFLARCVLRRYFVKGFEVVDISARRLLKTADRFDEGNGDFLRWSDAPLVLLDDIDKIEPTSRRLEALWEFFDRRESNERRTIVTGNVPLERLAEYLQPRDLSNASLVTATLDRLRPVRQLKLYGESQRGKQRTN